MFWNCFLNPSDQDLNLYLFTKVIHHSADPFNLPEFIFLTLNRFNTINFILQFYLIYIMCFMFFSSFQYTDVLWPDCPVYMTAQERAGFLNMDKLVTVIEKHGTDMDYWHLGLKQYLKLYG